MISGLAYTHVRTAAMARRLLTPQQLESLVGGGLDEIGAALGEAGIEPDERLEVLPSDRLEFQLVRRMADEILRLTWGAPSAARRLLRHWAQRYTLINIKTIVRGRVAEHSAEQTREQLFDLGPLERISLEELTHAEDVDELFRLLEVGPYAGMARQARAAYEQGHNLFDTEAVLDRAYLDDLAGEVERQPAVEREALRGLLGPMLDGINLVWLLRYRFAYGLESSHAYYLLAPPGQHLKPATLMEMAQLNDLAAILERLPGPMRRRIGAAADVQTIEENLDRFNHDRARRVMRFGAFRLARTIAYLWLRERQLRQLQGLVKGRQLGLSPDVIRRAVLSVAGPDSGV